MTMVVVSVMCLVCVLFTDPYIPSLGPRPSLLHDLLRAFNCAGEVGAEVTMVVVSVMCLVCVLFHGSLYPPFSIL